MKQKHLVIHILAVLIVFSLMGTLSHAEIPVPNPTVHIIIVQPFLYPIPGSLTRPQKINDALDIVGTFVDANLVTRGFIRFANGSFSAPIVEPNDTSNFTEGRGINNSRTICGDYVGSDGFFHGFFRVGGRFTEYDIPDATNTETLGINDAGDFAGGYTPNVTGIPTPFTSIGGTVRPINITGSTLGFAYQLNAANAVCGYYADASGINHGWYQDSNGALSFPIDPPGSLGTILFGINDQNWMVGRYTDGSGVTHGLLYIPPRSFVTFDYPDSTFTSFNGINRRGYICGRYIDTTGIEHGILARAVLRRGDAGMELQVIAPSTPARVITPAQPAQRTQPKNVPAS